MPKKATASSQKTKPMPDAHKELPLSGTYSAEEYEKISYGFLPKDMDNKWFIYLEGDWLYFHRSWTGNCVFQLQLVLKEDYYQAVKAIANRDPEQYRSKSDQQDVQIIAYLIDHLLLGRFATLPTPQHMSEEDKQRHQQHVMGTKGADSIMIFPRKSRHREKTK